MSGFCTAPRRANATITTIVSSVVGSCHETMVPAPTPRSARSAATPAAGVAQLATGERPAVVVGEQHVVGPLVGGLLDECPHGRRVRRDLAPRAADRNMLLRIRGPALSTGSPRRTGAPTCGASRRPDRPRGGAGARRARHGSAPPGTGAPIRSTWCGDAARRAPDRVAVVERGRVAHLRRARRRGRRRRRRAPRAGRRTRATRCSCSPATTSRRWSRSTRRCGSAPW